MKPRKVAHWYEDFQKSSQRRRDFYDDKCDKSQGTPLSTTSEVERGFVWSWCEDRFLEDTFPVVALTYWVRCKAKIAVNFLLDEKNKELYMVVCIHIAMKWLGYDEDHKCDFLKDLQDVCFDVKPEGHRRMEIEILEALNWVFMGDIQYMSKALEAGSSISGPWRLTVWERNGSSPCYLFSEEHSNEGSCPEQKDIVVLAKEILRNTQNVHVFIEHFVHALEINKVKLTEEEACSAKSTSILNNMRNCLEVLRVERPEENGRIHFVDPRMDIVSILPDGKIYEAISHYTDHLVTKGDSSGALMTVYEAFIHPLLSVVPDKFGVKGRMTGVMERYMKRMDEVQKEFFMRTWKSDVVKRIKILSDMYVSMQKSKSISRLNELKLSYTDMVNKFMDMVLLAQFFAAENTGMTASLVYAGSLHSLNFETYLRQFGYTRTRLHENKSLSACILL